MFNSEDRSYALRRFIWDNELLHFNNSSSQEHTLVMKPLNGCKLFYREEYNANLMNDDKHAISSDIADYFVFPDLRTNASKEYSNGKSVRKMEDLIGAYLKTQTSYKNCTKSKNAVE